MTKPAGDCHKNNDISQWNKVDGPVVRKQSLSEAVSEQTTGKKPQISACRRMQLDAYIPNIKN